MRRLGGTMTLNHSSAWRYHLPWAQIQQGTSKVRQRARSATDDRMGVWLAAARRWEPLLLLLIVTNILVATAAWFVVGLLLDWIL
jgi:hypothetical protein